MKKPPYKAYRKKEKEKLPVEVPKEIDTPQAEQLVSDVYRLYKYLQKHWKKLLFIATLLIIVFGGWEGYRWYQNSLELKAARLVDEGIFLLEENSTEKAVKLFRKAAEKFPDTPSGKIGSFLAGKLSKEEKLLENLAKEDSFLTSSPAKTSLAAKFINKSKLKKAESYLDKLKRDKDWTYPEGLEYRIIIALKRKNLEEAKNALAVLKGDYPNLQITKLSEELLKER